MLHEASQPPKPRSEVIRPEITFLPRLSLRRRIFRRLVLLLARLIGWLLLDVRVSGRQHVPRRGPLLVVSNHLGDADLIAGWTFSLTPADVLSKAELYDYPVVGALLRAYGVIWVHRGQPDRRALRAAIQGLEEGRIVAIAPEGRESVSGSLEEGTGGAAYLAWKSGAPILPVAFTGTENAHIYGSLRRLRRAKVTAVLGEPFLLEKLSDRRLAIEQGTAKIMQAIADLLPAEYRGVYRFEKERQDGN
jgi:1-acyl-sn-glycerol-3-phosphate acyltransferase